jgi:hypothetical protein
VALTSGLQAGPAIAAQASTFIGITLFYLEFSSINPENPGGIFPLS